MGILVEIVEALAPLLEGGVPPNIELICIEVLVYI
jgi:hypothetical protein